MSDKSFGDHTNRNVVKNPLLLTAVTGLSLEDLTHNAVLLPVAQSQELITRQDQHSGFQSIALAESDPTAPRDSPNVGNPPPPTPNQNDRTSTVSKASKSDDDFDVNEYFARLQGTRYVSAPINSTLKEDPQVDLQATEENLEEINLNEPEKPVETQSITADIAQNFSQLPTVLPQVASAVFSSFSNLMNYKSREQTPDEKPSEYKEVHKDVGFPRPDNVGFPRPDEVGFPRPDDVGVPMRTEDVALMGMDEPAVPKEVPPPPTVPPPSGASSYRITTRKKIYAQIPGLSSQTGGSSSQMPGLNADGVPGLRPGLGRRPPPEEQPPVPEHRPLTRENRPPSSQPSHGARSHAPTSRSQLPERPPLAHSATPENNASRPGNNASMAGNNATMPGNNAPLSGNNNYIPGSNARTPGINDYIPGNNAHMPGINDYVPGNSTHRPGSNDYIPGNNAQRPGINDYIPVNNAYTPGINDYIPGNNAHMPGYQVPMHQQPFAAGSHAPQQPLIPFPLLGMGVPDAGYYTPLAGYQAAVQVHYDPGYHGGSYPPNYSVQTYQIPPVHPPRQDCYVPPDRHAPPGFPQRVSPAYSPNPQADTKPTMFHEYMNRRRSFQHDLYNLGVPQNHAQSDDQVANVYATQPNVTVPSRNTDRSVTIYQPSGLPHRLPLRRTTTPDPSEVCPSDEILRALDPCNIFNPAAQRSSQAVPRTSQNIIGTPSQMPQAASSHQGIKIFNPLESHQDTPAQNLPPPDLTKSVGTSKEFNILNPLEARGQDIRPAAVKENEANLFTTVEQKAQQSNPPPPIQGPSSVPSTSIIPPPPMFSNLARRDSQSSVGKAVLPPSVARRIGAHHPIIKPQTMQPASIPTGNIFVPATTSNDSGRSPSASDLPRTDTPPSTNVPSAFVQFHASSPSVVNSKSGFIDGGISTISIPYKQPQMRYGYDCDHEFPPAWFPPGPPVQRPNDRPYAVPDDGSNDTPPPLPQRRPKRNTCQCFDQEPASNDAEVSEPAAEQTTAEAEYDAPNEEQQAPVAEDPTPEAARAIPEPPKVTGNLNYRMTNRRPQYYSGPIEGVGAISNSVRPVIPTAEPYAFQGAVFIPSAPQPEASDIEPAPFDISQPTNSASYAQNDINQAQATAQPGYNTAFDVSRPISEPFEPPQESKGFGIIGSLKSKLSALDINKIQNTVTTFFDPAYNDAKEAATNEGTSRDYNQGSSAFGQLDGGLEIFVPNNEQSQTYTQGYNSQLNYPSYNYSQSNQYYQNQPYYTQNQGYSYEQGYASPDSQNQGYSYEQGYASPVYGNYLPDPPSTVHPNVPAQVPSSQDVQRQVSEAPGPSQIPSARIPDVVPLIEPTNQLIVGDNIERAIEETNQLALVEPEAEEIVKKPMASETPMETSSALTQSYNSFINNNEAISTPVSIFSQINVDTNKNKPVNTDSNSEPQASLNFFDNQQFHVPTTNADISDQLKNMQISQNSVVENSSASSVFLNNNIQHDVKSSIDFFENITIVTKQSDTETNNADSETNMGNNLLQIQERQDSVSTVDVSSVPLFDLSTILAAKSKESEDHDVKNVALEGADRKKVDSGSSIDFTENISTLPQPLTDEENEGVSELSICETCREVTKPEEKDVDDLTRQLIENITSPIQLSNPVVAPLTESNTPVDVPTDFESNQCAEISHITEETIETIQVQSATELLDEVEDIPISNVVNYGWKDETFNAPSEVLLDHDYTFQMDPNVLGFYGSNAMFFENIPNNASDELKAEFKSSQEDSPVVLPSPISVPSAPPAEDDDTKSDETGGLDVHSIEQDAKKDFPIFEEFVIEPSETDDDKIEYKERERSSDDPDPDVDSFTNRVEKFKKMEETDNDDLTEEQKNMLFDIASASQNAIASPSIAIASYFDTGNFAVESHYRNSLSSPSGLHFQMGSPEIPMRIPPGFENEFKRRLSGLIAKDNTMHDINDDKDKDKNLPNIPETSTQTPVVSTTTYSSVSNVGETTVTSSNIGPIASEEKPKVQESDIPTFAVFRQDSGDAASPLANIVKKETAEPPAAIITSIPVTENLPDPIGFFSSAQEATNAEPDNNFNRLASYFTTPAKTDPEKSFFELSQSQNHYRHATSISSNNLIAQNVPSSNLFSNNNIPADAYLANIQLIKDLTSPQNIEINKDQIVRTVNYFTVEYDNDEFKIKTDDIKKDDSKKENLDKSTNCTEDVEDDDSLNDDKILTIMSKCKHCCNLDPRRVVTFKVELDNVNFKVRKAMDTEGSDPSKGPAMEGKKDEKKTEVTVTFEDTNEENAGVAILSESRSSSDYSPVKHHWFYRVDVEGKSIWRGFSATDSRALEEAFHSPDLNENTLVATDGGRFDVNVMGRLRIAVYWPDKPTNVRRCSWFYKGATLYVPYTEPIAEKLEEEYRHGVTTGEWHRRLVLPNNESVVMHGPAVMVHFPQSASDPFGSAPESTMRPRVVRRGIDEAEIEDPEPSSIDHLLLLCHGVGSACDMRFRPVEEVVDDFRATSLQLLQSHYRNSFDKGVVNRVEVLPISWHSTLHSGETGVDKRLAEITLESIPRLRSFTNDTLLDVLLYTSPVFCQTIIDTVCAELNRIYKLFKVRNPLFKGSVSLGGHSLGSVILYDLLCHQLGATEKASSPDKSYVSGGAGTGQPSVIYPNLEFTPAALYALGSPIAMFECIRGVKSLGADFTLPTCKNFFNIFHPYDPIAYRIEPLINSELGIVKPYLIPHHKGRKRMHLELKDTMARVGADLKQKLLESIKATWTSMWKAQPPSDGQLEKVVEEEIEKEQLCEEVKDDAAQNDVVATPEMLGRLNAGRRVDYVLQEAPFEMINEYLFAMSSHVCYWESEDTMLLILREIYDCMGVQPDCTVPQQSMTVQRTRVAQDETIISGTAGYPSTSRGGT
ncbi:uncharacterized protein LOC114351976 isoform X2 [Ostrinia furnacalis]|uniref:uncharacterized protein LOC114351976 isoform X2 n=1 Tax=Ostrinia furnacalis TaxID=93504 RepID=UPI00103BCFD2|nr:uncharacterized protein LOC114351976 isoform X2 [Ostrinia furnacalis]